LEKLILADCEKVCAEVFNTLYERQQVFAKAPRDRACVREGVRLYKIYMDRNDKAVQERD